LRGRAIEYAAVEGVIKQAKHGQQLGHVAGVQMRGACLDKTCDDTVKVAIFPGDQLDARCQRLAKHVVGLAAWLSGNAVQGGVELVRSAEHLLPSDGFKPQHAFREGP
jgi:hypothetical protein